MTSLTEEGLFHSLHCIKCKKLLKSPIMLMSGVGNICSPCFAECDSETVVALRNTIVESIIAELNLPCEYRSSGCDKILPYHDFWEHLPTCIYKHIKCVYQPNCCWSGYSNDLIAHLLNVHKEHHLNSTENIFKITSLESTKETIKILSSADVLFLCRLRHYGDKLKFLVYTGETQPEAYKDIRVHFTTSSGNKTNFRCATTNDINDFLDRFEDLVIGAKLEIIDGKSHIPEISVDVECESKISKRDETMLRLLECQVCKLYMRPPILQCIKGHDICNTCKTKITVCPLCTADYSGTRNYTLESLVNQFKYPCVYEHFGCRVRVFIDDDHESQCKYQPWGCPIKNCTFDSNYSDMIAHMKDKHRNMCIFGNTIKFDILVDFHRYLVFNNRIFELIYSCGEEECCWTMRSLAAPLGNIQCHFEISFLSSTQVFNELFTLKGLCKYESSQQTPKKIVLQKKSLKDSLRDPNLGGKQILTISYTTS